MFIASLKAKIITAKQKEVNTMPNIKSQIKRDQTNKAANLANKSAKSELHTAIKKVETLVQEGKKEEAVVALNHAISLLDKLSGKGIVSVNSANRKKAHLQHAVDGIAA